MGAKCFIAIGVFSVELSTCQVSMLCSANCQNSSIYIHNVKMTSLVISFAHFTHFSNLNTPGTNADMCKG